MSTIAEPLINARGERPMGQVRVEVTFVNDIDYENSLIGLRRPEDVRRQTLLATVDTGAGMALLPQETVEALGLRPLRRARVRYADGRVEERTVAGLLLVQIGGREAHTVCVVGPRGCEPLVGQLVLEETDLLVDCNNGRVVPNPESPDQPLILMY
jgi:predicted aspartyl protease